MKKYGICCRRVVDTLLFDPNWYVPDEDNPYCIDYEKNPLYNTKEEAEKKRLEFEAEDFTKNYLIYEVEA